jgi:TonB family protein
LGVRSMLVMPLDGGKGPFGILEVLSARPNAFGDRDIEVLKVLARRIVASKRESEAGPVVALDVRTAAPLEIRDEPRDSEVRLASTTDAFAEAEIRKPSDIWTTVLVLLVIAAAVALGVMIGWRGAAKRWMSESRVRQGVVPVATVSQVALAPQTEAPAPARLADLPKPASITPATNRASRTSSGDLVVMRDGKVIYRLPRSSPSAGRTAHTKSAMSESSSNRLIHQVEPEYPNDARAQHIQGPVVLDIQVLGDGTVGNIGIVEGNPLLAEAAVHAVRQWRYEPNLVDGHSVESQTRIKINFTLPSAN